MLVSNNSVVKFKLTSLFVVTFVTENNNQQVTFVSNMSTRIYRYVGKSDYNPLGRQPLTILAAIRNIKGNFSVKQVVAIVSQQGYYAAAGTEASVAWHLNQMLKRNVVELAK